MSYNNKNKNKNKILPINRKNKSQSLRHPTTTIPRKPSKSNNNKLQQSLMAKLDQTLMNSSVNNTTTIASSKNNILNNQSQQYSAPGIPILLINHNNLQREIAELREETNKIIICFKQFPLRLDGRIPKDLYRTAPEALIEFTVKIAKIYKIRINVLKDIGKYQLHPVDEDIAKDI